MEQLVEASLLARESQLAAGGALVVRTGQFTGRSPGDKFVVRDAFTESTVVPSPSAPPSAARFATASASPFACVNTEVMKLSERSRRMNAVTSHTMMPAATANTRLAIVSRRKCPG